jgi:hypothetical protein
MKDESEDWKRLCELVANESDAQKISVHLSRLIQALDARNQSINAPDVPQKRADVADPRQ